MRGFRFFRAKLPVAREKKPLVPRVCKCRKEKEKVRRNNAKIRGKRAKKYTQALRVNYAYIKKTDLSLEVNTAILEVF